MHGVDFKLLLDSVRLCQLYFFSTTDCLYLWCCWRISGDLLLRISSAFSYAVLSLPPLGLERKKKKAIGRKKSKERKAKKQKRNEEEEEANYVRFRKGGQKGRFPEGAGNGKIA